MPTREQISACVIGRGPTGDFGTWGNAAQFVEVACDSRSAIIGEPHGRSQRPRGSNQADPCRRSNVAARQSRASVARRQSRLKTYDASYEPKGLVGDPCVYCGVVSDTMDHVPPLHYVQRMCELGEDVDRRVKYPACHDCNTMLGGVLDFTVTGRRAIVKEKIRRRYAKFLRIPGWDEDELDTLSPEMRRDVIAHLKYRDWIMARLGWMRGGNRDRKEAAHAAPRP
jgi:hypothetical protein